MSRMLTPAAVVATVVLLAASAFAQAPTSPTAYIGDDLEGLRAAVEANPDNIGLRMRVVNRLLAIAQESSDVRKSRDAFAQVEREIEAMRELGPEFPYPYRVLSRLYYRRDEYGKVKTLIDQFAAIANPDQEMRSLYVKSLLRAGMPRLDADGEVVAVAAEGGDHEREAAEYVGNWFDSADAPGFGATLGAFAVWLVDEDFRTALLDVFARRYEADRDNLNLVISYAACLAAIGRYESAWDLVHDAERRGLCDTVTGARHPVAYLLEMSCPEIDQEQSYDGMNVEELEKLMGRFPENVSFPLRAALVLKRRGDAQTLVARRFEREIEKLALEPATPENGETLATYRDRVTEFETAARENYVKALPHAEKAQAMNPDLLTIPLLLGDIRYRLDDLDAAIASFEEGVARLPLYGDLREGLARVHVDRKDWQKAADNLAELAKYNPCDAANWDTQAETSLLPVPRLERERMMLAMIENPEARGALVQALRRAAEAEPKNPNPKSYLAMAGYFSGDRDLAARSMLEAERVGLCGTAGFEHTLATLIYSRSDW